MKKLSKINGVILRRKKILEKDFQIDLLSEQGSRKRFRIFGIQNSKKRNIRNLDPGNQVALDYYESKAGQNETIYAVREFHCLVSHTDSFETYARLTRISFVLELIDTVTKEFGDRAMYMLATGCMELLAKSNLSADEENFLMLFIMIRCLKFLGVLGNPELCSACGDQLETSAVWKYPEMYFHCKLCDDAANAEDFQIASLIYSLFNTRFSTIQQTPTYEQLNPQNFTYYKNIQNKLMKIIESSTAHQIKSYSLIP